MKNLLRKTIVLAVIVLLIWIAGGIGLRELGGAFDYEPEALETGLTPGARALLEAAYDGIDPDDIVDHHVHVVGLGTDGTGTWVHPKMLSWTDPIARAKTLAYLSGSDVTDPEAADEQYVARLVDLARHTRGGKLLILGFDYRYDENGEPDLERSEFHTPNEYVFGLAEKYPDVFIPAVSVHPHRKDAVAALEKWAKRGARIVKWLPNAMGINAGDERHDAYYRALIANDMVLLAHVGEEQAVHAAEDQKLGNPLLFRRPLDLGVTVVMAHSASLGTNEDIDNDGAETDNFELFLRLMDEPQYLGRLYGEISAMTQINRLPEPLAVLLRRTDLHARLVNGSDYPLPAINVVIHTRSLVKHGMLTPGERELLNEIYEYNPLLFDFAVKRTLRAPDTGTRFAADVFTGKALEPVFMPPTESAGAD